MHSFGISKQLKIAKVEDSTKVPQKFRYPFFTEMLWYALAKYVRTLLGRSHLVDEPDREDELQTRPHTHLTHYELFGLKEIVMYLYDLPPHRKNVPELIRDPVQLIKDVRGLVERHCRDVPALAITGRPVLVADPDRDDSHANGLNNGSADNSSQVASIKTEADASAAENFVTPVKATPSKAAKGSSSKKKAADAGENGEERNGSAASTPRRRRRRCKVCVPCNSTECGQCAFCLDMVSICLISATKGQHFEQFFFWYFDADQIRRPGTCQANVHEATMLAADAARHRTVHILQFGWLAADAGCCTASKVAQCPGPGTVGADGVLGLL